VTFDLAGRRALVTHAAEGIGRATALALAGAGATVVACHDRDGEAIESLARQLKETGGEHLVVRADLTRPAQVATVVRECRDHLGAVDILVSTMDNAAAVPLSELTPDAWRRALDGTLTAALLVTQGVLPLLAPGAAVVNVGATLGTRGEAGASAGAAAAAGLIGLTRCWAKELGPTGVRVNLVAIGPAVTGRAAEVAAVVLFLAGDAAGGVNGETFTVDGGE
jgi:3-oxoacyl-[acyl-carrier protein] reductase